MEKTPTLESVLRSFRELQAKKPERQLDAAPKPLPEEIERAIRE